MMNNIMRISSLVFVIIAFSLFLIFSTHHNEKMILDPILNLSSLSNTISLNTTSFTSGVNASYGFFSINVSNQTNYIPIPKYSQILVANLTLYGQNFTGNLAYTPPVSTSSGGVCKVNHTNFTGYVFINGVNKSVSRANFVGGLYSATGSCSASVSTSNGCASPGVPYPSSTEYTGTNYASPSCGCPSGYTGTNYVSVTPPNYQQPKSAVASSGSVSFTCNSVTNPNTGCGAPSSCSYTYLYYTANTGYSTSPSGVADSGTTSYTCPDGTSFSIPPPGSVSTVATPNEYAVGIVNPGGTLTCPNLYGGLNTCEEVAIYYAGAGASSFTTVNEGTISAGQSVTVPGSVTTPSTPLEEPESVCYPTSQASNYLVPYGWWEDADGVDSCGGFTVGQYYYGLSAYQELATDSGHTWPNPFNVHCTTSGGCKITSLHSYTLLGMTPDEDNWYIQGVTSLNYYWGFSTSNSQSTVYWYLYGSGNGPVYISGNVVANVYNGNLIPDVSQLYDSYSSNPPWDLFYPTQTIYENTYYTGTVQSGSASPGSSVSLSSVAGVCYNQNMQASEPTTCYQTYYYCSPSSVTYNCQGTYNGTGSNLNYCLSSTPGKIVYSASCPPPGSGTITSVTAIPFSCFNHYNNTAVSNISIYVANSKLASFSGYYGYGRSNVLSFASQLQSYLNSCSPSNGNCTVPITIQSYNPGVVKAGKLIVKYKYNISALYSEKYDIFNTTFARVPITPNKQVGYGANLSVINQPFTNLLISGFYSKVNCQIGIANYLANSPVNSSGICPTSITLTTSKQFSMSGYSSPYIYVFNKLATPVTETIGTGSQNKSRVSIPGVVQYIYVSVTIKNNESSYGVSTPLNISLLKPNINGFVFNNSFSTISLSNGTYTLNVQYSGNEVLSKESVKQGNYASWKTNTITIEDIWNNTSPYSFTNLTKVYSFPKGTKIVGCSINGTNVLNTSECSYSYASNGTLYVKVVDTSPLPAGKYIDPTITVVAPNVTETESAPSQISSQLYYNTQSSAPSSPTAEFLSPVFQQIITITNNASFTYPSINISSTIPAYNQVINSSISIVGPNGPAKIYYINLNKGIVNWTTYNLSKGTTTFTMQYSGVPLRVEVSNLSSFGVFEQQWTFTAPPGLPYSNFQLQETTPILVSLQLCTTTSLTSCTPVNTPYYLPGTGTNIYFNPSISSRQFTVTVGSIPANGSIGFVVYGIEGKPINCTSVLFNETPVIVGQVIQVYQKIRCVNPNDATLKSYTFNWQVPPNAFNILTNSSVPVHQGNQTIQPIVSTPVTLIGNGTYVELTTSYLPYQAKNFTLEYKVQPLSIVYKTSFPTTFYTNIPALATIEVILSNEATIPIYNASYLIPISYGLNASFIINNTQISYLPLVNGSFPITFPYVPPNGKVIGTIYYHLPTAKVIRYPQYTQLINSTLLNYFPFAIQSISPVPMPNTTFVLSTVINNTPVCSQIVNVYQINSPSDTSGTPLPFTCQDNGRLAFINLGSMSIGSIKYVLVVENSILKKVIPTPTVNQSVLSQIINAIISFFKAIATFFENLFSHL